MTISRRKLMAAMAATLAAGLAGCGQKGPLYRPEDDKEDKKQATGRTDDARRNA